MPRAAPVMTTTLPDDVMDIPPIWLSRTGRAELRLGCKAGGPACASLGLMKLITIFSSSRRPGT